ncbi:MAG: septum formation inhibitor Maf [Chloroflexi bacterium]|nr:septum formation inhibitor Maf [Chloroflexota bacterium]MBI4332984.1 septum formation inhibitor Maf [Chloroflexota bacterium]
MRNIVLASASPRRRDLLEQIGLRFVIDAGDFAEQLPASSRNPEAVALDLACRKAAGVAARHPDSLIIGADTLVVLGHRVLGKPANPDEARKMLRRLGGRAHTVITGICILDSATNKALSRAVQTRVWLKRLSPEEIDAYVKSREPLDKAGAYGIQGLGSVIVKKIEGDYFNVVGLPLYALAEGLMEFGVEVLGISPSP